jgi:prevent-host-death family protein
MRAVNIQQAKTHLSRLVDEAEAGKEIIIAKVGRPCVRLVPIASDATPRELGRMRGRVKIAADFDAESADVLTLFGLREAAGSPKARPRQAKTSRRAK